ncbi:unnamed protein product, partial [Mesorhabditis belari]|uniref:SHSP domain-containing protein n=1 Tax=Mesorhabditis belari TaxID=2138241 RepID=A0AAF3F2B9_9BILA
MLQRLSHRAHSLSPVIKRGFFHHSWEPALPVRSLRRHADLMEREFERAFVNPFFATFRPYRLENPLETEQYRLTNPIVEENGNQFLKLAFDVRRFKPEEVSISTNSKDRTITIEAKHEDETSQISFTKKFMIPEGVTVNEMTCRYDEDGVLNLKAPYVAPKVETKTIEKPEPKEIPIKHE